MDYEPGKYSAQIAAKYAMDVNLSVYSVPVYGKDGQITGYNQKATIRANSFVSSAGENTIIASAQVSLISDGTVLGMQQLQVSSPVYIPGGGQYSYIGEATFDLPSSGSVQIGITGGWVIEYDNSNRFVPITGM